MAPSLQESLHSQAMGSSSTERASFATTARLLSCLVTESLVRAIFVPLQWSDCVGIGVVLKAPIATIPAHNCKQEDTLAIVLLTHAPVLKTDFESSGDPRGREIGLLDPLDMFPLVLVISKDGESSENEVWFISFCGFWFWAVLRTSLHRQLRQDVPLSAIRHVFSSPCWSFPEQIIIKELNDPLILWDSFATVVDLDPTIRSDISDELASSVRWQAYSYDHPPNAPTLLSPSIDWEQSIAEGHPTHPVRISSVPTKRLLTDED